MSSYGQQRRSAKKQKNKAKLQKRSKILAKQRSKKATEQPPLTTHHDLNREMTNTEVIESLALFCVNAITKNEKIKSPRRNHTTCCAPSIFNEPDLTKVSVPSVQQIQDFVNLIFEKRRLAAETGVVGFVLLMRTNIKITSANWMRLVMIALLLANKEAEDFYNVWNVRFVGIVPNLQVYEINLLEMEFLQNIKYRLHVEPPTYQKYYQQLVTLIPISEMCEIPEEKFEEMCEIPEENYETESENASPEKSTNLNPLAEEYFTKIESHLVSSIHNAVRPFLRPGKFTEKNPRIESIP
jgi:hypothetical protein